MDDENRPSQLVDVKKYVGKDLRALSQEEFDKLHGQYTLFHRQ